MSLATVPAAALEAESRNRMRAVTLVFCCTLIGAVAQVLIKSGANTLQQPGLMGALVGMLTHGPLFAGYALYGVSMVLLTIALREGELSMLYPVIALTFVWVTILSLIIFHESMNPFKLIGITLIVCGVGLVGKGGKR